MVDHEFPHRLLLPPHPPRVPLGSRRRLHRPRPDRPALARRLLQPGRGRRDGAQVRQPPRAEAAAAAGQGQERHLPLHVRRTQPRRYLRLQAQALRPRRPDHPGQDVRPRRQEKRGPRRRPQVEIPAVRPVRPLDQRPLPAPLDLRGRHRLPPLDDGRLADPRLGPLADEHGQDPVRQPVSRLVGQLRSRQRQRGTARFRGDARPDRRPHQRRQELVERLHAGQLSGHGLPLGRRPHPRPLPARRPKRRRSAPRPEHARRVQRRPPGRARRQQQSVGPHRQLRAGLLHAARCARMWSI